jgi:hypothetical protein
VSPSFSTYVLSCAEREAVRAQTLAGLAQSGWTSPVEVVFDTSTASDKLERIHHAWREMLRHASRAPSRYVLLLEDDVIFGKWFNHNLAAWPLLSSLTSTQAFYASLYNPARPYLAKHTADRYIIAEPETLWGAQALVLTPGTARYLDNHWDETIGNPDQRMPRLAGRVTPIYLHLPSLVDHAPVPSTWGGITHVACDFDPNWRAETSNQEPALEGAR